MQKNKLIIFDLDGVIINSLSVMERSWEYARKENNLKPLFKHYKLFIGLPFYEILKKLKIEKNKFYKTKNSYFIKSKEIYKKKLSFFPNAKKTIKLLSKKYLIALFTSKDKNLTKFIIKKHKLSFDFVVAGNQVKRGKPHKSGVTKILKKLKVKKNHALYVGDTQIDFITAKNSSIMYIHANWGFEKKNIKNNVSSFKKLQKFINKIL